MSSIPHHRRASAGMCPSYSKQLIHHMACHCHLCVASFFFFFFLVTEKFNFISRTSFLYCRSDAEADFGSRQTLRRTTRSVVCLSRRNDSLKFLHLNLFLVSLPEGQEFKVKSELQSWTCDRNLQVALKKKSWVWLFFAHGQVYMGACACVCVHNMAKRDKKMLKTTSGGMDVFLSLLLFWEEVGGMCVSESRSDSIVSTCVCVCTHKCEC